MASAFEWAAKNVVRELSRNGELIPVDSLKSSTHFSPYYLVRKKARSSLFWRSKYVWLNLTLKDILDPSSPEPEVTQHGPFHFNDEVDGQVSGSVEVTASVKGKISGQTSVSNKTILEVKTLIVSPNTWDSLQKERMGIMAPVAQTSQGSCEDQHWPNQSPDRLDGTESAMYQSDSSRGTTVSTVLDFEQLQAEVENEQSQLTMLDRKLQQFLLQALLGLLQSEQDLLELEDMLEQSLYTGVPPQKVKGMTGDILSNLQDRNGQLVEELAGAFLYLLGARTALSDIQHQLLIQLLQKKEQILSQEVELVKAVLKENFNQTKKRTFSLPSKLLSFVQGQDENLTLTCGLLEECGLWLSGDEPQFTWNPSALYSLCALHGSLVMLQALTEA
ncbi:gasdermin-D-like [Vombatus ursinus]|uniref:gasdermin-D-like n=1 Tax=Vombatus ursinus TaxID=29139 RepID=UPI000FFD7B5B|nr:gasdermin-D-like [Vombatus ursinus]